MNKLIVRMDDLGISKGVNYGIYTAAQYGLAKACGLMSNMEDAVHGYELIKDFRLNMGLHVNIVLGKPVSNENEVKSLLDESGNFKNSCYYRSNENDTIVYEEVVIEIENQIKQFEKITGFLPEYIDYHAVCTQTFVKAISDVCNKKKLLYIPFPNGNIKGKEVIYCDISENEPFDVKPVDFFEKNKKYILNNPLTIAVFHPGYIDSKIMKVSSLNMQRAIDLEYISNSSSKEWLVNNNVKLVDFNEFKKEEC